MWQSSVTRGSKDGFLTPPGVTFVSVSPLFWLAMNGKAAQLRLSYVCCKTRSVWVTLR